MQQDSFDARLQGQKPESVVKTKTGKGWMACSIVSLLLLVGVSVYAVIATVNNQGGSGGGGGESKDVAKLQQEVNAKNEKLDTIKSAIGVNSIDDITPELITSKKYDSKYIYIPEAGMKVEIPSTLKTVSYLHRSQGMVYIWAVPAGFQYFPDFADPEKNHGGLAAISVNKKVDNKEKVCQQGNIPEGVSCTAKYVVDSKVDGYAIEYSHPQALYSSDSNSAKDESNAAAILMEVLTNPDNYSEI